MREEIRRTSGIARGAIDAPAGDGVPRVEMREHRRNVVWIVLQIGVHDDHVATAHGLEPGVGGRGLPRIGLEAHQVHARVFLAESADDLGAPIHAPVVDEDDLVDEVRLRQDLANLRPEQREILFLVVDGNDDGEIGRGAHGGRLRGRKSRVLDRCRARERPLPFRDEGLWQSRVDPRPGPSV